MNQRSVVWVRHTWDLRAAQIRVVAPDGYVFDSAAPDEWRQVAHVVLSAYESDPAWSPVIGGIRERMADRIRTTLGQAGTDPLVARRHNQIVAASVIAREHRTDQNLLTGVCVSPRHQRRGLGQYLLGSSLVRLREMGLREAQVYTLAGSLADRKIYPLFGSRREEGVQYPGAGRARGPDQVGRPKS